METEERDSFAKPKPSKQMGSNSEVKQKESSAAPLSQFWLNSTQDSTLTIPEKGKDVHSKSNLDLTRQFEGNFEITGKYGDRSSGRSEKEGTSCKNYTHDHSTSAANGDKASSDESDDSCQGLSATKKLRLNQTNADDYSLVEDSAANMLDTVSRTTKINYVSELSKQRRKQMNRESAKRSRFHKQGECEKLQSRIEALKADSHELCKELDNLSEECERIGDENQLIKDELIRMYGPCIIQDLKDSLPEFFDHEDEVMRK